MRGLSHPEAVRAGRYITVGLVTNVTLYLLFLGLVILGLPPVGVSAACYLLGVALSYLLNRRWSFRSAAGHRHDLPRFLAAYGAGLAVTVLAMSLLAGPLGPALAQLLTIAIAALTIYSALRLLGFGTPKEWRDVDAP